MYIGGLQLIPDPTIDISMEYFYCGTDIIGGIMVLKLDGTHHAEDKDEYNDMLESIVGLNSACCYISTNSDCAGVLVEKVNGTQGLCRSSQVSHGGSPLDLNYSIVIECATDSSKNPIVPHNLPYISSKAVVHSVSENVSYSLDNPNKFSFNSANNLVKVHGKLSARADISFYNSDQCASNALMYKEESARYLYGTISSLLGASNYYKVAYDRSAFTLAVYNSTLDIRELGGSATAEAYLIPKDGDINNLAIVDISYTESTNQQTELRQYKVKGSITGLDSGDSFMFPVGDAFSNAQEVYNKLYTNNFYPEKYLLKTSCVPTELAVSFDKCWRLTGNTVSEYAGSNKIDFEMTYDDVEKCTMLGYTISVSYEERPAVKSVAEHVVAGRSSPKPLLYHSNSESAPKFKLTVEGNLPESCDESQLVGMIGAINSKFILEKTKFNLNNKLLLNTTKSQGRYSYSKTEEYIECQ